MTTVINLAKKPGKGDLKLPEGVVPTSVTSVLWRFFESVVDDSLPGILPLGAFTGRTGIGKSFTARAWAEHRRATYLSLSGEDQVKRNSLLQQIHAALIDSGKLDAQDGENFDFARGFEKIKRALVPSKGAAARERARLKLMSPMRRTQFVEAPAEQTATRETLIIDEAQRLSFDGVQVASDLAEAGAAVILVGTDTLRDTIFGPAKSDRERNARAPVVSRFNHRLWLPDSAELPIEDDIEKLARAGGISDPAAIDYLRRLPTSDRALREVARHIVFATRAAGGAPVTLNHVKDQVRAWGQEA